MKAGDTVKLIEIPPGLRNDADLPTRTLFEKCLGHCFVVTRMETVEGLPYQLARLDVGHIVGKESWRDTIWVEPEYLQLVEGHPNSR
jgi:hypothetical protein